MPNYQKPLWIVLDPKGRLVRPFDGAGTYTTRRDAILDAIGYLLCPWVTLQKQGYRCVKVKRLEW